MLESISSINQGLIWAHPAAAAAFGSPLPCKPAQLAAYIAAQKLGAKNPGDPTNVNYGNVDYFLLSQVVAKLSASSTFEEGLTSLVLKPLQITRVREARSLQAAQKPDEAIYHLVNLAPTPKPDKPNAYNDYPPSLWVANSSVSNDRPLVPQQYGGDNYEAFDGCGGLSAAVIDIARLLAACSLRSPTAVFTEATLQTWFDNTVKATKNNSNPAPDAEVHGYHGFDWGSQLDETQPAGALGNFKAGKGGWMPSHSSVVEFVSGGFGYIVASNSVGQSDIKTDWLRNLDGLGQWWEVDAASVMGVTQAHDWGTIDLFPAYGMPSFTAPKPLVVKPIDMSKLPRLAVQNLSNLERKSITSIMEQAMPATLENSRPKG